MKELFIMRHAKAVDRENYTDDFTRPLHTSGYDDAKLMSDLLNKQNITPDIIISSPATRAYETANVVSNTLSNHPKVIQNPYIYEPYVNTLIETLSYTQDDYHQVLLVGHNPGVSALAYMLCGLKENLKTSSIVHITFNCSSWLDISNENSKLRFVEYPSKYR